jgi:hypothetical protein
MQPPFVTNLPPVLDQAWSLVVALAALATRAQFKTTFAQELLRRPPRVVTAPPVLGANWKITHAAILPAQGSATKATSEAVCAAGCRRLRRACCDA